MARGGVQGARAGVDGRGTARAPQPLPSDLQVIDASKYFRHAYLKPDLGSNSSLLFTYDSIHTHSWVSWAMAREVFHLVYQGILLPEFAAVRLKLTGGAE